MRKIYQKCISRKFFGCVLMRDLEAAQRDDLLFKNSSHTNTKTKK